MKPIKFLQYGSKVADYIVQSVATTDLQRQPLVSYEHDLPNLVKVAAPEAWRGEERRQHEDRRSLERRNARQSAMLDTRAGLDRRRDGRRETDELQSRSISFRV